MESPSEQSTPRRSSNVSMVDSEKQATMVSPSIVDTSIEEAPLPSPSTARSIYLKIVLGATSIIVVLIFSVFSIYWGALWKIPAHNLHGWVVVRLKFPGSRLKLTTIRILTAGWWDSK